MRHELKNIGLRQLYRDDNYRCELCSVLKTVGIKLLCQGERGLDLHHIVGGTGGRWDVWGNFLTICRPAHNWCHKFPREGRIVCVSVKWAKGEMSETEWKSVSGQYLEGSLEIAMSGADLLPGFVELGAKVIEEIKKGD